MDDSQRIVKCGNLCLHSAGGFFKKRWLSKYLVLYDGSKSGIKRLELFDSEIKFKKQNPSKIIPLVDCVRVVTCQRSHKTRYTFEVRMSEQLYLLAAQSFQDMNDWVNCIRLVAFGQPAAAAVTVATASNGNQNYQGHNHTRANDNGDWQRPRNKQPTGAATTAPSNGKANNNNNSSSSSSSNIQPKATNGSGHSPASRAVDVLLDKQLRACQAGATCSDLARANLAPAASQQSQPEAAGGRLTSASQAAAAAASALAKTRQRQPSLFGSCKPQPPLDSPFIASASSGGQQAESSGESIAPLALASCAMLAASSSDTLTPTVRGQLISSGSPAAKPIATRESATSRLLGNQSAPNKQARPTLDEEEENMLYCSIEDNPSEHNYRVKVIETQLALRCQLKCYQLTESTTVDQQYQQLQSYRQPWSQANSDNNSSQQLHVPPVVTFYQLIIGPQELTLLNDYASAAAATFKHAQQQGLWSWPYQCIRRYGFDKDNCFMFEAGRKCTSGPGQFIVQTPKAYNIYQDVVKFVNELRSLNPTTSDNTTLVGGPNCVRGSQHHNTSNCSTLEAQASNDKQTITQIPVTWTRQISNTIVASSSKSLSNNNNNNNNNISNNNNNNTATATATANLSTCADKLAAMAPALNNKEQFFRSLQNLDSSSVSNIAQRPTTTPSNLVKQPADKSSEHSANGAKQQVGPLLTPNSAPNRDPDKLSNGQLSHSAHSVGSAAATAAANTQDSGASSNMGSISPSSTNSNTMKKCDSTDETDESGYEQGCEDSVLASQNISTPCDSNDMNNKSQSNSRNKPIKPSSGSSARSSLGRAVLRDANSTNPTASATGCPRPGPIYSVINKKPTQVTQRKCVNSRQENHHHIESSSADVRPTKTNPVSASKTSAAPVLSRPATAARDPTRRFAIEDHEDFEATLIRDVYSEISKLHATFAVTTEDSMSSHSSNSVASNETYNQEHELSSTSSTDESSNSLNGRNRLEPTYSNLRPRRSSSSSSPSSSAKFVNSKHDDNHVNNKQQWRCNDLKDERQSDGQTDRHKQPGQNNKSARPPIMPKPILDHTNISSYEQQDIFNYFPPKLHPMYMTTLNPIPECREPAGRLQRRNAT